MTTHYVCKYTPVEIIKALGGTPVNLNVMHDDFDQAELVIGPNICGFGKTVVESVLAGNVRELVLVNCCDSIKSVYDILLDSGKLDFLYVVDVMRSEGSCAHDWMVAQINDFARVYGNYKGKTLTLEGFRAAFRPAARTCEPYIAVMGARMGEQLFEMVEKAMLYPVRNMTCVNNRSVGEVTPPSGASLDELISWYAGELIGQLPCMRMVDVQGRRRILEDPSLKGIVYHTVRFCDFYGLEYSQVKGFTNLPLVRIESDYTTQSAGQLLTRLEAFSESMTPQRFQSSSSNKEKAVNSERTTYYAGIDSGSTSTDVVILDEHKHIVAMLVAPTGAGASASANAALDKACAEAGIVREDIAKLVTTGYGRSVIKAGDKSVTEITCHARGVHFIDPSIRTIIDIGGQDSKAISLDEEGNVINFTMNDKCAAGTGRFLDMMARTMEMNLNQMSDRGIEYKEDITISSMCSVFAESEVVSLIAQNKAVDDIVHGLNKAVAIKTKALVKRVNGVPPFMMTGGVSRNRGVVKALEEKLGAPLVVSEYAQLCGALGAALLAYE